MGGVLHGVGEGDELLVVVVGTGPGLLDGDGAHRGITYAQKNRVVVGSAGGAGLVVLEDLIPVLEALHIRSRDAEYRSQLLVAASRTLFFPVLQSAATDAELLFVAIAAGTLKRCRVVKSQDLGMGAEPRVVDGVEFGRYDAPALSGLTQPSGRVTFWALD